MLYLLKIQYTSGWQGISWSRVWGLRTSSLSVDPEVQTQDWALSMATIPTDYSNQIKAVRGKLGLTQERLAEQLGVSFATVNRWEKGHARPSQLAWERLQGLLAEPEDSPPAAAMAKTRNSAAILLDFTANPEAVRVIAEGERLS